ncbi:vesicle-associated membrane protein 2 [Paragonimus westermani]|uniref:Vesicle-associated membrane protein 2 n=1 Tax=Paragonimus westermani TaxID=34504 RepID=A0A5J4P3T2_9TREM|nr:vesicle-associated membrane protein 2 [Paragonimus westermani]
MSATSVPTGDEGQSEVPRHLPTNKRLQQTQAQVDEVVDIMRTNVEKVLERDQKLSQLDDRAGIFELLGIDVLMFCRCAAGRRLSV